MKIYLLLIFLFVASTLFSQTTISFTNPVPAAPMACNDAWTESGIPQQVIPIPPDPDCGFDYSGGDLWLYTGIHTLDLSSLSNVTSIEIDLIDWCGMDCTVAKFFANDILADSLTNDTTGVAETMVFNNSAMYQIDEMTIQSFENQMFEIRIYSAPPTTCNDPAHAEVWVEDGDVYIEDACNGIILTSPNGTCFRVRVDNSGALISEQVSCP